ncbi:MAG: hypothetical protein JNL96_14400 [Planctomycetaceae bacterium]|nr:hypothetical protein [Planctomycetaceae bacterium]
MSATATLESPAEFFAEYAAQPPGRKLVVDRAASTISGVKLMGIESKNRRRFTAQAMADAFRLSENAKINVNHNSRDLSAPREYADRLGFVLSRTLEPDGIYGTVKINPKHPLAERLFWEAENAPHLCGFSPVYAPGKTSRSSDGWLIVETVAKVTSIDLVADPATANSLAEGSGTASSAASGLAPVAPTVPTKPAAAPVVTPPAKPLAEAKVTAAKPATIPTKPAKPVDHRSFVERVTGAPVKRHATEEAAEAASKSFADSITAPSHPWLKRPTPPKKTERELREEQRALAEQREDESRKATADRLTRRPSLFEQIRR